MTEGEGQSESASAPEGVSGLRRNSDDVGWEYGVLVDINNKDKVKCILCDKQMCGGVYRLKQHIAQEGKNAKKCQGMKTTKEKLLEAQEKCKKALDEAKRKREEKTVPISFNACDNDEFKQMCEAIGQFGPGIEPPTMFDLRGRLLEEEYARTKSLLQEREAEKMKNGCSIMTDACIQEKKDQLRKMVVHSRWDSLKDVKSKKGKNATTTILNPTFWKDVKLTLAVFAPLFKVLCLVDGDVKPSMGFVYGELLKAKRHVKEALGNVENRFKDVVAVIEKMDGRLDSPLHLTAYLLNPHYSYADPSIFDVP
ncbi:hypothetical protein ZEAMMB73_Zm00001d033598 [Zea mays]|uniref:BED-type domain-containing protein n=1 Tax=Zea mays TaxID=4577 RepID=A0A1D6L0B2_MAIZE|nr:hypothetical protein ZEAMMB73_Zm00001d033598 [Zea mays]